MNTIDMHDLLLHTRLDIQSVHAKPGCLISKREEREEREERRERERRERKSERGERERENHNSCDPLIAPAEINNIPMFCFYEHLEHDKVETFHQMYTTYTWEADDNIIELTCQHIHITFPNREIPLLHHKRLRVSLHGV